MTQHNIPSRIVVWRGNRDANNAMQAVAADVARKTNEWGEKNQARGGVCDFCGNELTETPKVTTWLSTPMIENISLLNTETHGTATLGQVMSDDWAACAVCDPIIERRDPVVLAEHVRATRGPHMPTCPPGHEAFEQADLTELYTKFFETAHRAGDSA